MGIAVKCPQCKTSLSAPDSSGGHAIRCGKCRAVVPVPGKPAPPRPAAPVPVAPVAPVAGPGPGELPAAAEVAPPPFARPSPPPPPPIARPAPAAPAPAPGAGVRAAGAHVGKPCSICFQMLEAGQPMHICHDCHTLHHEECWGRRGGCSNVNCAGAPSSALIVPGGAVRAAQEMGANVKGCPYCGEMVPAMARKCPKCQELLDPALREKFAGNTAASDRAEWFDAHWWEWVMAVLCGPIAPIYFLYLGVKGEKKGWTLLTLWVILYGIGSGVSLAFK